MADWQPGCVLSNKIREAANITTNQEFRKFLQRNGKNIEGLNTFLANRQSGVNGQDLCQSSESDKSRATPYLYKNCFSDARPFGYQTSDLKSNYLESIRTKIGAQDLLLTREQTTGRLKRRTS